MHSLQLNCTEPPHRSTHTSTFVSIDASAHDHVQHTSNQRDYTTSVHNFTVTESVHHTSCTVYMSTQRISALIVHALPIVVVMLPGM
jgi:hypothetical protein